MNRDAPAGDRRRDLGDGLQRPELVVGVHQRDQHRPRAHRREDLLGVEHAVWAGRHEGHLHALAAKCPQRLENGRVLDRARSERAEVVVLDVRPREEFEAGHFPRAISIPLEDLQERLGELPRGLEVVAYCRGPYCVLAPQAVELLAQRGFRARRLYEGLPEWRLVGLPVAAGAL